MKNEVILPWLDVGLKYSILMFGMYYMFIKCVGDKIETSRYAYALFFSVAMGFSLIWLRPIISPLHLSLMLMYLILTNCLLFRNGSSDEKNNRKNLSLSEIVMLSLLCFAFCDAVFFITGFTGSTLLSVVYDYFVPPDRNSVSDFLHDIPVHIAAYFGMLSIMWLVFRSAANMKRLRRGLMTIVERRSGGIGIMLSVLLLTLGTVFVSTGIDDSHIVVKTMLLVPILIFGVIMIFWIKREILEEYLRQLRERNAELLIKSISEKDGVIKGLRDDNDRLSEVIKRDDILLESMNAALRDRNSAEHISVASEAIERLYSDRKYALEQAESGDSDIKEIGVRSVDAILEYMANKAKNSGIAFTVDVSPEAGDMISGDIDRLEFSTMLADLTENALISSRSAETSCVAVNIGKVGESCCLEVLDNGAMFDEEVLRNMGNKRITTHSGEGGSGFGMITLFKILHHNRAGLTIEELPEGSKYTKSVRVTFDGSQSMNLITDRFNGRRQIMKHFKLGRFEVCKRTDEIRLDKA